MQNTFTIKEALSFGWKKMSENFWFLALLTLGFSIVSILLDNSDSPRSIDLLSQLLGMIVSCFAMFTFARISLKIYKGHKPAWKDVVEIDLNSFSMYILATIMFTIAYVVGFVLLVIPGIIVIVRFGFFSFALVDQKLQPIDSIKKSIALTRGHFWHLFGFGIVLAIINGIGALAFVIGLLVTIPLSLLATVYVYEKLKAVYAPASAPKE